MLLFLFRSDPFLEYCPELDIAKDEEENLDPKILYEPNVIHNRITRSVPRRRRDRAQNLFWISSDVMRDCRIEEGETIVDDDDDEADVVEEVVVGEVVVVVKDEEEESPAKPSLAQMLNGK